METITTLRANICLKQSDASRVMAFYNMIKHPDATWNDLINCLQYPVLIREQATMMLYERLDMMTTYVSDYHTDPEYWHEVIKQRGLDPNGVVGMSEEGWESI